MAAKASRALSMGNQLGSKERFFTAQSAYSLQVAIANAGKMILPSVVTARSSHSNNLLRIISDASASADITTALPTRSSIFLKRCSSTSSAAVYSITEAGIEAIKTI